MLSWQLNILTWNCSTPSLYSEFARKGFKGEDNTGKKIPFFAIFWCILDYFTPTEQK